MPVAITLLTDFGTRDPYVGAMRGVIAGLAPDARVHDVSHEIAPQSVIEAAFVLRGAYPYFPGGTVHVCVVDPGVGTARRAVALRARGHVFVGPDNGLFSLVLGEDAPDELVVLDRPDAWRVAAPSATFHGRDVFAPVAARIAAGAALADVGTPAGGGAALRVLRWALPIPDADGVRARVVHVDRFGNAVTNVEGDDLARRLDGRALKTVAGSAVVRGLARTYADVDPGEPVVLTGSAGLVEVAVRNGNAAELLSLRAGTPVSFVFAPEDRPRPLLSADAR